LREDVARICGTKAVWRINQLQQQVKVLRWNNCESEDTRLQGSCLRLVGQKPRNVGWGHAPRYVTQQL